MDKSKTLKPAADLMTAPKSGIVPTARPVAPVPERKKAIVFLDFDGVLHAALAAKTQSLWHQMPVFEAFFRQPEWSAVEFVITSSWRNGRNLAQLQELFAPDFRERIIGTTPALPQKAAMMHGVREREILRWLRDYRRDREAWLAMDDTVWYFCDHIEHLFLCNGATGFTVQDYEPLAIQLRQVCAAARPPLPSFEILGNRE
ncbi:MAG: HAD domain-containing protein [Conchiformibius sp.]|nr:HAD domain-containing protein [Conchiformibius sp.]